MAPGLASIVQELELINSISPPTQELELKDFESKGIGAELELKIF